jgi:histidinol-phosphate aminotransferase
LPNFFQLVEGIRVHTDPLATELRQRIGRELDVDPDQIVVANASDELIYLLCLAYLRPGRRVVIADPPYRLHDVVPNLFDGDVVKVALRDWVHDLPAMAEAQADIAFICNPHNPTGTIVPAEAVKAFINQSPSTLTIVDEAYIDFVEDVDRQTALPLAREGRLVVLRTFSKIMGMAGLRIGFMVASGEVVEVLRRVRPPFSVNSLAQAAGIAELDDREQRRRRRDDVIGMRAKLRDVLARAGYQTLPSHANFVTVLVPREDEFVARLAAFGLSVRPGTFLGIPGAVRIAVPSPRGQEALAQVPVP